MDEQVRRLREERVSVWRRMNEILTQAESRDDGLAGELRQSYDQAEARLNAIDEELGLRQRHAEREQRDRATLSAGANVDAGVEHRSREAAVREEPSAEEQERRFAQVFDRYMRRGMVALDAESRDALAARFTDFAESRDQGVGTGSAGGYTVPQGFLHKITERLKYFGPVADIVNVIETSSGQPLPWPNNDDTTNVASLLAENSAVSELDVSFGTKTLNAYVYTSGLVKVSWQLLQDGAFDLEQFLARKFGERIGRKLNTALTTGTGSSQPEGIMTNMSAGLTLGTGNTTANPTYANLVDLVHSLDPAYRQLNPAFQMNDSVLGAIRKLVDGQGRPLWVPAGAFSNIATGEPDRLLGYPVFINNDMATPAANAKIVAFGVWDHYMIMRRVIGTQVVRLDERFADQLQTGFFAYNRIDAKVDDSNAAVALVNSAT